MPDFIQKQTVKIEKKVVNSKKKEKTVTEASLLATAKKFNATWKDEIDVLNRDCIQSFSNFKCGTRIIQGFFESNFYSKFGDPEVILTFSISKKVSSFTYSK